MTSLSDRLLAVFAGHTEGEWRPRRCEVNSALTVWDVYRGLDRVARIEHWAEPVDRADARLIAASPVLLQLLAEAVEGVEGTLGWEDWEARVRALVEREEQ